jgi:hypothetical protein
MSPFAPLVLVLATVPAIVLVHTWWGPGRLRFTDAIDLSLPPYLRWAILISSLVHGILLAGLDGVFGGS